MGFIIVLVLVILFLVGSVSGNGTSGKAASSHVSDPKTKKLNEQKQYLQVFLNANIPLIQMCIRNLVEKDFWSGLSERLCKELIWVWLYRADQSHIIYLVLNTNLGGAKALLEYEENSSNPSFRLLRRSDEDYMQGEDALAAEIAANKALAKNLRSYDGSDKSRKAVEAFNDADGFMRKHRNLLAPNLDSWIAYSTHVTIKK